MLNAVRAGRLTAFDELRRRHLPDVERFVRQLTNTEDEARDLAARAFAMTLQRLRSGGGPRRDLVSFVLATARYLVSHDSIPPIG
ncbi:hypothetical protein [Lentzea sp. E54]|uniref:hypothetical protein n=1 Tax=Lentzea xerophila TaxID=3435883 RepID=UPI003DA66BAB